MDPRRHKYSLHPPLVFDLDILESLLVKHVQLDADEALAH